MERRDLDYFSTREHPVETRKRSVRERLGGYVDSPDDFTYKRFCGDPRSVYSLDETFHPSKGDLRRKIMQKNRLEHSQHTHRQSRQGEVDLRNLLSRPSKVSMNSIEMLKNARGHKFTGTGPVGFADDVVNDRHIPPLGRRSGESSPQLWVERYPREKQVIETREGRHGLLEVKEFRYGVPELFGPSKSMSSDVPGMRGSDSFIKRETRIDSPWNLDQLRARSPEETYVAPKRDEATDRRPPPSYAGISTSRNEDSFRVAIKRDEGRRQLGYAGTSMDRNENVFEVEPNRDVGLQRRYPLSYSGARMGRNQDAYEMSMLKSVPFSSNVAPPMGQKRSSDPIPRPLPQSGVAPRRNLERVNVRDSVESFLHSLGLESLASHFKLEEVDMYSLECMSDRDLAELNVPTAARKRILFALQGLREKL